MKSKELKVVLLSTAGQIIEFYDFMIFAFLADIISYNFFSGSQFIRYIYLFSVFAVGYIVRPLGGVIFGHIGDRVGRKKAFLTAIFLISIATFMIGLIPGYRNIGIISPLIFLMLRILQGFSLGGELPGAATFVYETIPKGKKIYATSFIFLGLNCGSILSSAVAMVLFYFFTVSELKHSYLWRLPFIIGGTAGLMVGIGRGCMMETPIFDKLLKTKQVLRFPVAELISKYSGYLIVGVLLGFITFPGTVFIVSLPSILSSFAKYYDEKTIFAVNTVTLLLLLVSIAVSAFIIQKKKINIYKYLAFSSLVLGISSFGIFYLLSLKNIYCLIAAYAVFQILYGSAISVLLPCVIRLFPPVIRYSSVGGAVNIAAIFTIGLVPLITVSVFKISGSLLSLAVLVALICLIPFAASLYLYLYPPDRKRIAEINRKVKAMYSALNSIPIENSVREELRKNIDIHAKKIEENEDCKESDYEMPLDEDTDFSKAGEFIQEYSKKILNAPTERERMILSRLMHYEYDSVVYGKTVSENLRKHIEEQVDLCLNNDRNKIE